MAITQSHSQDRPLKLNTITIDKSTDFILLDDSTYYIIRLESENCSWCHVMNRAIYENPDVVKFMNDSVTFYSLNIHEKAYISFENKKYNYHNQLRIHGLAIYLSKGDLKLPVTIFINKSKGIFNAVNGYILLDDYKSYLAEFMN